MRDFEVKTNGLIIGLDDGTGNEDNISEDMDDIKEDSDSNAKFVSFTGYKGLTLIKDEPLFIGEDSNLPEKYNNQCAKAVSSGVDLSIWIIGCSKFNNSASDYEILKW